MSSQPPTLQEQLAMALPPIVQQLINAILQLVSEVSNVTGDYSLIEKYKASIARYWSYNDSLSTPDRRSKEVQFLYRYFHVSVIDTLARLLTVDSAVLAIDAVNVVAERCDLPEYALQILPSITLLELRSMCIFLHNATTPSDPTNRWWIQLIQTLHGFHGSWMMIQSLFTDGDQMDCETSDGDTSGGGILGMASKLMTAATTASPEENEAKFNKLMHILENNKMGKLAAQVTMPFAEKMASSMKPPDGAAASTDATAADTPPAMNPATMLHTMVPQLLNVFSQQQQPPTAAAVPNSEEMPAFKSIAEELDKSGLTHTEMQENLMDLMQNIQSEFPEMKSFVQQMSQTLSRAGVSTASSTSSNVGSYKPGSVRERLAAKRKAKDSLQNNSSK